VARSQRQRRCGRRRRRSGLGREADGRLHHPDEDRAERGAPNAQCFSPWLAASARSIAVGRSATETESPSLSTSKRRISETIAGTLSRAAIRHMARIPLKDFGTEWLEVQILSPRPILKWSPRTAK